MHPFACCHDAGATGACEGAFTPVDWGGKPTVGLRHGHCYEIWKAVTCEASGKTGVARNERAESSQRAVQLRKIRRNSEMRTPILSQPQDDQVERKEAAFACAVMSAADNPR